MKEPRILPGFSVLMLVACADPSHLEWDIVFAPESLSSRAVRVTGEIRQGGCDGEVIFAADATRMSMPAPPPNLDPGTYGFAAMAQDDSCIVFAAGCTAVTLPDSTGRVETTLMAAAEIPQCAASQCVDGFCEGVDAGDAGSLPDARDGGHDADVGDVGGDAPVTDGALPDAPVDAARRPDAEADLDGGDDAEIVDSGARDSAGDDAAVVRTCLDPMATFTSEGCVLPTPAPCSPFDPCTANYACTATSMGDRCVCTAVSVCGPSCTSDTECSAVTPATPTCHLGRCYADFACHGAWSSTLFCDAGEACQDSMCVAVSPRGSVASGSECTADTDCVTGRCESFSGFPSAVCVEECDRTADCAAGTCSLSSRGGEGRAPICAPTSVLPPECGSCRTGELCIDDFRAVCVQFCRASSDCGSDDCHLSNGSALPTCQNLAITCGPEEFVIDVDSGRAQACSTTTACYVDSDCAATYTCMAWAYGGLRGLVQTCARIPWPHPGRGVNTPELL